MIQVGVIFCSTSPIDFLVQYCVAVQFGPGEGFLQILGPPVEDGVPPVPKRYRAPFITAVDSRHGLQLSMSCYGEGVGGRRL